MEQEKKDTKCAHIVCVCVCVCVHVYVYVGLYVYIDITHFFTPFQK